MIDLDSTPQARRMVIGLCVALAVPLACSRSCDGLEPVGPTPLPVGGSASTGGSTSTGGSSSIETSTSGSTSTGGSSERFTLPPMSCPKAMKGEPVIRRPLKWRRSRAMRAKPRASYVILAEGVTTEWPLHISPNLDQEEGSCTGYSLVQTLSSGWFPWRFTAADGKRAYYRATELDAFVGTAPEVDTGSDGKSALRAAVEFGWVDGYYSPTTFEEVQAALLRGPCMFGSDWHTGMWTPDSSCQIHVTGPSEGGHEYEVNRIDFERKQVRIENSWGPTFGENGKAALSFGDFVSLMNAGGEFDCPNPPR